MRVSPRSGAVVILVAIGCAPLGAPFVTPLYGDGVHRLPPAEVATLHGPIGAIDGRTVVDRGRSFELLPGCHVVMTRSDVGELSPSGNGAWAGTLPRLVVAFHMKPAHVYSIDVERVPSTSARGQLIIGAHERAPSGAVVAIPWARGQSDIDECIRPAPGPSPS